VAKSSISLSQKPVRLLLLRNACSFCQSVALERPIQELDAYSNLARTTAINILEGTTRLLLNLGLLFHLMYIGVGGLMCVFYK